MTFAENAGVVAQYAGYADDFVGHNHMLDAMRPLIELAPTAVVLFLVIGAGLLCVLGAGRSFLALPHLANILRGQLP